MRHLLTSDPDLRCGTTVGLLGSFSTHPPTTILRKGLGSITTMKNQIILLFKK